MKLHLRIPAAAAAAVTALLLLLFTCVSVLAQAPDWLKEMRKTPYQDCLIFPADRIYYLTSPQFNEQIKKLTPVKREVKFPRSVNAKTWLIKTAGDRVLSLVDGVLVSDSGQAYELPAAVSLQLSKVKGYIRASSRAEDLHYAITGPPDSPVEAAPGKGAYLTRMGPAPILACGSRFTEHLRRVVKSTPVKEAPINKDASIHVWVDGVRYAMHGDRLISTTDKTVYRDSRRWLHRFTQFSVDALEKQREPSSLGEVIDGALKMEKFIKAQPE